MKKLSFKDLKRSKGQGQTIEFLGLEWRIREMNLIDLEEIMEGAKDKAEALAIEKLKGQKKELEKEPVNLEKFDKLNKVLSAKQDPPANKYEEKLNKWKGIFQSGLIAIGLLETLDGQGLGSILTNDKEVREVLNDFASTPGLMNFINTYLSSWSAPEKNG